MWSIATGIYICMQAVSCNVVRSVQCLKLELHLLLNANVCKLIYWWTICCCFCPLYLLQTIWIQETRKGAVCLVKQSLFVLSFLVSLGLVSFCISFFLGRHSWLLESSHGPSAAGKFLVWQVSVVVFVFVSEYFVNVPWKVIKIIWISGERWQWKTSVLFPPCQRVKKRLPLSSELVRGNIYIYPRGNGQSTYWLRFDTLTQP